mgnify:CR=1 FL=1
MAKDKNLKLDIMTRELRLLYYNNYLFNNGVITKREHDKMNLAIISKCGKRRKDELGEISLEERLSSVRSHYDVRKEKYKYEMSD